MKKPEMKRIPKHVLSNYGGNTRNFKLKKRRQVKELNDLYKKLQAEQIDLDEESKKILYTNLWNLYN